jgi:hypothetical protein
MFRPCLLIGLLLLVCTVAAHAQGTQVTDCSISCNSQTLCTRWCTENGSDSTCGNYGVCDPDPDGDGLDYYLDNCPNHSNVDQADCDGDGRGDVCDVEDGTYVYAESRNCWIRNRLHAWGSDSTWYAEARYHDISSCGSPDKWVKVTEDERSCVGNFDPYDCCLDIWGFQNCYDYAFNTCHF